MMMCVAFMGLLFMLDRKILVFCSIA